MSAPHRHNMPKRVQSSTKHWQICYHCRAGATTVVVSLRLPAAEGADETLLLLQCCSSCGTYFVTIANESRRGSRDRETVWGYGYQLNEQDATHLKNLLDTCPNRYLPTCKCPVHTQFLQDDTDDYWDALERNGFNTGSTFSWQ